MNGVSASGKAAGWRTDASAGTARQNYMLTWNGTATPTAAFFNGLDGTTAGEAFLINGNGTIIFGRSPILVGGTEFYAYKVVNPGPSQTINALPEFPDTGGSASRAFPYGCTPDGKYAVGMNYRGMEKAVVWDTGVADTNNWTILDLTELARLRGIIGDFDGNLRRAYSVGTNSQGLVVTGKGVSTGVTRAFVMTVPLPIAPELTISGSGGSYTVSYLGLGNATNVLEYTTNLSLPHTWTPIDTNTSGSISTYYDYSPPDTQRFYRAHIQ
jgi:hypothetical protein